MTIRKSIVVARKPAEAFRIFTEEIGAWWPGGFSGKGSRLSMETFVGGRFIETRADGTDYEIGRLTAYQPPHVVSFSWRAPSWDDITTQVEVRFSSHGDGTRIELEHSGWEQDAKTREVRGNYNNGWETILGYYVNHCAAASN